jgi:hypothetical protein
MSGMTEQFHDRPKRVLVVAKDFVAGRKLMMQLEYAGFVVKVIRDDPKEYLSANPDFDFVLQPTACSARKNCCDGVDT